MYKAGTRQVIHGICGNPRITWECDPGFRSFRSQSKKVSHGKPDIQTIHAEILILAHYLPCFARAVKKQHEYVLRHATY